MEMRGGRRFRSVAERRQIVEETLKPGATVSGVAREMGISRDLIFHWRKQYRAGGLDGTKSKKAKALLAVRVTDAGESARPAGGSPMEGRAGSIEIEFGRARLRVEGRADPECLRAAIEERVRGTVTRLS